MRLFRASATIVLTAATLTALVTSAATASAASTPGTARTALPGNTSSAGTAVTVKDQTRVPTFTVPASREVHSLFKVSGTAQRRAGSGWTAARSVLVEYFFRVLPSGKWTYAGTGRTNSRGAFSSKLGLVKFGHTAWQARVRTQTQGSTEYLASTSATRDSFFTDRTYVTMFVAMHLYGYTDLAAIMTDYPPSGGVSYRTVTGVDRFYYHPKGTNTWRYLGSARTDGSGSVAFARSGTVDGYFRIVFPAQGDFLGSVSNTEYLG
jgi:hypothetical protein